MDRFAGSNNIDLGSGRMGYRDRNLGTGSAGSIPRAAEMNAMQETLMSPIEASGIAADIANWDQLLLAIRRLAAGNFTGISANTTLTADKAGFVVIDATGGNVTITLPSAAAANGVNFGAGKVTTQTFEFYRYDSSANTVTIQAAGGQSTVPATITLAPGGVQVLRSNTTGAWVSLLPPPLFSTVYMSSYGSRALGTVYTNGATPRLVAVNTGSTTGFSANGYIGGVNVVSGNTAASGNGSQITMIVPPFATYEVTVSAGTGSVVSWVEVY